MIRNEEGSVTAEFAVMLPAVLIVVGIIISAITLSSQRILIVSASHEIARLEARGDANLAAAKIALLPEGTTLSRDERGGLKCIILTLQPVVGPLQVIKISAVGCAAPS